LLVWSGRMKRLPRSLHFDSAVRRSRMTTSEDYRLYRQLHIRLPAQHPLPGPQRRGSRQPAVVLVVREGDVESTMQPHHLIILLNRLPAYISLPSPANFLVNSSSCCERRPKVVVVLLTRRQRWRHEGCSLAEVSGWL
jgi:hypothetical protein